MAAKCAPATCQDSLRSHLTPHLPPSHLHVQGCTSPFAVLVLVGCQEWSHRQPPSQCLPSACPCPALPLLPDQTCPALPCPAVLPTPPSPADATQSSPLVLLSCSRALLPCFQKSDCLRVSWPTSAGYLINLTWALPNVVVVPCHEQNSLMSRHSVSFTPSSFQCYC